MSLSLPTLTNLSLPLLLGTSLTILTLAKLALNSPEPTIIPSPRETVLPKLSSKERDELPYGPDIMLGGRDVGSRYGTMRVYEWGPITGHKILLIHGISTPCLALRSLAELLVAKGCRVMLFDLFGRGYSDSPNLPHDARLYSTQILLALTSSPISWTPEGFTVIGYSFGGGICADFAADFPNLVKGLVLLAPSGLIRSSHFGWTGRIIYSSYIPESWRQWIVKRRLGAQAVPPVRVSGDEENPTTSDELKGNRDPKFDAVELRQGVSIGMVLQWQLDNHQGYLRSFISSMRHSNISGGGETWRKLGERREKTMVVAGSEDAVIIAEELKEDVEGFLGDKLEWRVVDGGHEFPVDKAEEVVVLVGEFLKLDLDISKA